MDEKEWRVYDRSQFRINILIYIFLLGMYVRIYENKINYSTNDTRYYSIKKKKNRYFI